jgi:cobalamin synthase
MGDDTPLEAPELWNPNAAANWCLIFSPVFGAVLHAKNWKELGNLHRAKANKIWIWITAIWLTAMLYISVGPQSPLNVLFRILGVVLLLIWYFSQARVQAKLVKERYGIRYKKKKWGVPLLLGVGAFLGYVLLAIVVASIRAAWLFGGPF